MERGEAAGGWLGRGLCFVEAGARGKGAPTTRVERGVGCCSGLTGCGCGRKVGELTGGAGCQRLGAAVAEASSAAAVGLARSWAESGGWAGLSGEGERRVNGPHGKKAMQAETEEGRRYSFSFLFSNKFSQKHFQIIFELI